MGAAAQRRRAGAAPERKVNRIGPQPGPQTAFLMTNADIAIYGGGAGGGKTYALLLEPVRHVDNKDFDAIIFRKSTVQVRNQGGLWDESETLYPLLSATGLSTYLTWTFPSGAVVKMAHMEMERTKLDYQGAQIPLICWDELTHFSETQFFYMLSRNRSMSGVPGYVRATCNPDPDSWVAKFIAWWIDQETGFPIPERAGVLRWFVRINDIIYWADTPEELRAQFADLDPDDVQPKSVTFIPALLSDNPLMMRKDPTYKASLLAMPKVDRERLLGGNWKIRPTAGLLFQRSWCEFVDAIPARVKQWVRGWDLASTPKTEHNDPDWTTGTMIGALEDGRFIVAHHTRLRDTPGKVERHIKNTASADRVKSSAYVVSVPQDPGQAGKWQVQSLARGLAGYEIRSSPENGPKDVRFGPFSAQAEAGNVLILKGDWNEEWCASLEAFDGSDACVCDDADSTSRAFNTLAAMVMPDGEGAAPQGEGRVSPFLSGGDGGFSGGGGFDTRGRFDE